LRVRNEKMDALRFWLFLTESPDVHSDVNSVPLCVCYWVIQHKVSTT